MKGILKKNPNIISQKDNETGGIDYVLKNGVKLSEVFNFLPAGIIDKRETGIGATTLEIECYRHSIIIEPLKSTVLLKAENNKNLFPYLISNNNVKEDLEEYLNDKKYKFKKIILVIDNLKKLINDIGNDIFNYFLLFDEIDYMQGSSSYRINMELGLDIGKIQGNFALVSATLIDFSDPYFKKIPLTSIKYENLEQKSINLRFNIFDNKSVVKNKEALNYLCSYIVYKLKKNEDKIFIAYNNVKKIDELASFLVKEKYISFNEISLLISDNTYENQLLIDKYSKKTITQNKLPTRLNFVTSAYFNGYDLIDNYSLIILSSPFGTAMTLTINEIKQIYGRCRNNGIIDFLLISFDLVPDEKPSIYLDYTIENWLDLADTHLEIASCIDKHFRKKVNDLDSPTAFFYNQFKEHQEENKFYLSRSAINLTKENLVEQVLNKNMKNKKNVPAYLQIDYLYHHYLTLKNIYTKNIISEENKIDTVISSYVSSIENLKNELFEIGFIVNDSIDPIPEVIFLQKKKTHNEEITEALNEVLTYIKINKKEDNPVPLNGLHKTINTIINNGSKLYTIKSIDASLRDIKSKKQLAILNQYVAFEDFKKDRLIILLKGKLPPKSYTKEEIIVSVKSIFKDIGRPIKNLTIEKAGNFIHLVYRIDKVSSRIEGKPVKLYKLIKHSPFPRLKKAKKPKISTKIIEFSLE